MQKSRTILAGAVIAMATLLASCSPTGVADARDSGIPEGVELTRMSMEPAVIDAGDGSVKVVTFGSGSCPATATSFENDGEKLAIEFEVDTAGACTADISPTTHTFSEKTVGGSIPDTAEITFPEFDEEYVVNVIRG